MSSTPSGQPERKPARLRAWLATLRTAKAAQKWVGVVLNVAGVAGLFTSLAALVGAGDWAQSILAIALSLIAIGFGALAVRLQIQVEQVRIDARGSADLRRAHEPLAKAANALAFATASLMKEESPIVFPTQAHEFAREMAQAYTLITGAPCRVTVKHTYDDKESGDLAVRTLFSSEPQFTWKARDKPDLVKDNTDFSELLGGARPFWLEADVTKLPGYVNSHYSREDIAGSRIPYRSVLVWPVAITTAVGPKSEDADLLGFLCLDSSEVGTFDSKRDVSPGEILSHALCLGLQLYKERSGARDPVATDPKTS